MPNGQDTCARPLTQLDDTNFPQDVFTAQSLVTGARKAFLLWSLKCADT